MLLGDFNCQIGDFQNYTEFEIARQSTDKKTNSRAKQLIRKIVETDMMVLNGSTISDEKGFPTFTNANGSSVIDICLIDKQTLCMVKDLKVLNSLESSHFPILITLNDNQKDDTKVEKQIKRIRWDYSQYEKFKENVNENIRQEQLVDIDTIFKSIYKHLIIVCHIHARALCIFASVGIFVFEVKIKCPVSAGWVWLG